MKKQILINSIAGSFLIPKSTARQIQEISEGNADPLILVPESADLDLFAVEEDGTYSFEFGESEDEVEPPTLAEFIDARGYNPHEKEELLSFLEEWGCYDPDADEEEKSDTFDNFQLNLDEPIENAFFDHWVEWDYALRESPKAQAYSFLESLPPGESEKVRVFQKNLIGILHYPDLENGRIATREERDSFFSLITQMQQAIDRYPASYHVLSEDLQRFQSAEQMLKQGNVLISGEWKPESEMEFQIGPVSLPELEIEGRVFRGVRLTEIEAGRVKFMHSSGVEIRDIDSLSEEVISKLNRTSEELRIVATVPLDEMDEDTKTARAEKILEDFEAGTLIDLEGKRYTGVKVKTVEDNAILIFHSKGTASLSFDILPEPIKIKFGYDPVAAAAAKKAEEKKQAALRANAMAEAAAREEQERKKQEMARLLEDAIYIRFKITQVIDEGLLIWNLNDSKTELLKVDPDQFDVADGEIYTAWVVSSGTFDYESIIGVDKRVRAWTFIPTN